jgi:hypothetical protein
MCQDKSEKQLIKKMVINIWMSFHLLNQLDKKPIINLL